MNFIFCMLKKAQNHKFNFFESLNSKKLKKITLIFANLKNLNKHGFNFLQKNARAKKQGFTFLEYMKVQKIRIQSFCKLKILKHAQIQSVKTAKCFRKRHSHFLQTQTLHKSSFQ